MNICKRVPVRYHKSRNAQHYLKSGIKIFLIILIAVQFLAIRPGRVIGASTPTPNSAASPYGIIEYVMDLSASMARPLPDGETIWDKTRASIATYENYLLSSSLAFSLRTFGYPDLDCEQQSTPNKPIIAPRMGSGLEIVNAMKKIVPNPSTGVGRSGILWAISKAADDLSAIGAAAGEHRSIIVFTDGKENCVAKPDRQAWLNAYLEKTETLAKEGIQLKSYLLIIVPEEDDICSLFKGQEERIECIAVSEVEASNLPGVVESILFETISQPDDIVTPTLPVLEITPEFAFTPMAELVVVPTGKPLPTLNPLLLTPIPTPAQQANENTTMDIKVFLPPILLIVTIVVVLLVFGALNYKGLFRRR